MIAVLLQDFQRHARHEKIFHIDRSSKIFWTQILKGPLLRRCLFLSGNGMNEHPIFVLTRVYSQIQLVVTWLYQLYGIRVQEIREGLIQ